MSFLKQLFPLGFLTRRKPSRPALKERFRFFQELLDANNRALEIMGEMEEKVFARDDSIDRRYVRTSYDRVREEVHRMIRAVNRMVPGPYEVLPPIFQRIDREIQDGIFGRREIPASSLTIPFSEITREMSDKVGGKNANLGEMRNRLGLPVPEGFAITAFAYKRFLDGTALGSEVRQELETVDINDLEALSGISGRIRDSILSAPLPPDLESEVLQAYDHLAARLGQTAPVSIRSSAVREDSEISFAGQYATVLNVRREDLLSRYKEILASKFTPQAIFYWKEKGFSEEDIPMAVACQAMIPAKISGVMYSQDPNDPERKAVIISAIWGLGELSLASQGSPNVYVISRESGQILETRISPQGAMLVCREGEGTGEEPVPPEIWGKPCLDEEAIRKLYACALRLEEYYHAPQDIEWVIGPHDELYFLQTRLLKVSPRKGAEEGLREDLHAPHVLIDWGVVAAPGAGAGPVFLATEDRDLDPFPSGAVLVVKNTSPKYITVMNRASAIVTDVGNVTGHMASLAREFRVPTIVDTKEATQILRNGQIITVDALRNRVYDGMVEELLREQEEREKRNPRQNPVLKKLEELRSAVIPLNLVEAGGETFKPENCRTFHDITRFIHESSILEMFRTEGLEKDPGQASARSLVSEIPIHLDVIDLEGGLAPANPPGKEVRPQEFTSRPLIALWRGLTHPQVRWTGAVQVDLKGFASVMINTLSDSARYGTALGEKSYALVSREYMNFSSRLAYHFSTVDAYCSEVKNNNYITFHFMGGGSSAERRSRRARFIGGVLRRLDFDVEIKGDWLLARLMKYECRDMEEKLDYLGRLICCARQLDMVMYSDQVVDWYIKAFLQGNYAFEKRPAEEKNER